MGKKNSLDSHLKELEMKKSNSNGKLKTSRLPHIKGKENRLLKNNEQISHEGLSSNIDNIDKLVQFIEGSAQNDIANKKAEKKARQKQKKEDERRRREEEEEAQRRAEEERIRMEEMLAEQARIREELALQKALKKKKGKQQNTTQVQSECKNSNKKKKGGNNAQKAEVSVEPETFEQTIPAMVTIKRVVENNNSPPTVTITLKGSTPDQDQLLYTLVNGHDAPVIAPPALKEERSRTKADKQLNNTKVNDKKKKNVNNSKATNGNNNNNNLAGKTKAPNVETNEIKAQLAIDKSFRKDVAKFKEKELTQQPKKKQVQITSKITKDNKESPVTCAKKNEKHINVASATPRQDDNDSLRDIIDIPSLKLPPGITITKVSGPLTTRKTATAQNDYTDVPVSKLGVIVVDTEKLIQQQSGKKKKKKNKKGNNNNAELLNASQATSNSNSSHTSKINEPRVQIKPSTSYANADASAANSGMVTLKNPIFHTLQNKMMNPSEGGTPPHMININEQATISCGENGIVTIRRSRPVGFYTSNESPISEYLSAQAQAQAASTATTKTSTTKREPIMTPWQMPDTSISALSDDRKIIRPPSPRSTQWPRHDQDGKMTAPGVLQGLPGIEITRVKPANNSRSVSQSPTTTAEAEVTEIVPTEEITLIRTDNSHTENSNEWTCNNK